MNIQIHHILEETQVLNTKHSTKGLQANTTFSSVKICPCHIIKGPYTNPHPLKRTAKMIMTMY